jgi:hypothetical protein
LTTYPWERHISFRRTKKQVVSKVILEAHHDPCLLY